MQLKQLSQATSILFIACILSGFNWLFYRPDIQQGNIVTEEQISQLTLGMTKKEVEDILGKSLLPPESVRSSKPNSNALIEEEIGDGIIINYVYRYEPGHGKPALKKVSLLFEDEKLTDVSLA